MHYFVNEVKYCTNIVSSLPDLLKVHNSIQSNTLIYTILGVLNKIYRSLKLVYSQKFKVVYSTFSTQALFV